MFTPEKKLNYLEIATEIAEWIRRNYGYFVNKISDKNKINEDFAEQLERLPIEAMSYIKQIENNFIDSGIKHPPTPATFIQELKICFNKIKAKNKNGYVKVISKDYLGNKYVNKFTKNGKLIDRVSL